MAIKTIKLDLAKFGNTKATAKPLPGGSLASDEDDDGEQGDDDDQDDHQGDEGDEPAVKKKGPAIRVWDYTHLDIDAAGGCDWIRHGRQVEQAKRLKAARDELDRARAVTDQAATLIKSEPALRSNLVALRAELRKVKSAKPIDNERERVLERDLAAVTYKLALVAAAKKSALKLNRWLVASARAHEGVAASALLEDTHKENGR